jgi:predicted site-specific integrase-resolvase
MTEEKTRMKKFIQNGVIRYARVPYSLEGENEDLMKQIQNLKALCDGQRKMILLLEETYQLQEQLITEALGPISQYDCYT